MPDKCPVVTPKVKTPTNPYSLAMRVGNQLFISGQVALDAEGRLVGKGDLLAQTRQVLENIKALVEAAGGNMDDIVKTTTFVTSMQDFAKTVPLRREYFHEPYPASTAVQVAQLVDPDWLIEIEATAVLP
jgi:2-iminobutanoate/2-iminopropanoate deaminase